jgi:hypothetical protein
LLHLLLTWAVQDQQDQQVLKVTRVVLVLEVQQVPQAQKVHLALRDIKEVQVLLVEDLQEPQARRAL